MNEEYGSMTVTEYREIQRTNSINKTNIDRYTMALDSTLEQIEEIIEEYGSMSVREYMQIQKANAISQYKILIDSTDNEVKRLKDLG